MGLLRNFQKKRAIKSYIKKLPSLLAKDYGKSKTYTPKQVKRTIERGGLSVADACLGIAMFSTKQDFDQYHQEIGESCNYDAMRNDIGNEFFGGNAEFGIGEIVSVSSDFGGGYGEAGISGGDGGGGGDS